MTIVLLTSKTASTLEVEDTDYYIQTFSNSVCAKVHFSLYLRFKLFLFNT